MCVSCSKPLPSEWTLDEESFRLVCQREFVPQVDLFATRENRKLSSFVSPVPDPLAVGVDAFSLDWSRWEGIYLFPPFSQILRVVLCLQHYQGRAILITPDWPNQPWFPILLERAKDRWDLLDPKLFQFVGEDISWASSKMFRHLVCWIF